jgi:hypothetical protein
LNFRKLLYYARSSLALARRLRRRRDLVAVILDPSRVLHFEDGRVLRVRDRLDLLIVKETLCDDVYGLSQIVAPSFIIDVGAGIGSFAVPAARRFPECRVLAFEPDPLQFAVLPQPFTARTRSSGPRGARVPQPACPPPGLDPGFAARGCRFRRASRP